MVDVRCGGCHKMLGNYVGKGNVKCSRCGGTNIFDTSKGEIEFFEKGKYKHALENRSTSSGVTFSK